ncbi:MAG: hypothetical protein ACOVRN_01325 [Flavobacterium sp.]
MGLTASPLEVILFVIFVAYLVFQPSTPPVLTPFVDNLFGTIVIISAALYMFLYLHPVLGVLGIFVAYELIRRTSKKTVAMIQYSPEQPVKDMEMKRMNPPKERTLEEAMVAKMAPVSDGGVIVTDYVPVADDVRGASMI